MIIIKKVKSNINDIRNNFNNNDKDQVNSNNN